MTSSRLYLTSYSVVVALVFASRPASAAVTKAQCISANADGQALRQQGKFAEAREQLRFCSDPKCPGIVAADCTKRLDELETAQPSIIFDVKDGSGHDVSAVTVTLDGRPLTNRLDGSPLQVEPGEHSFAFTMADQAPVTRTFVIKEGSKDRHEAIVIGAPPPPPPALPAPPPSPPPPPPHSGIGTQRVLGLVLGGIGVVGLGLGTVFGVMALSKKSDAQSVCPGDCSTQDGVNKWSDAAATGNISTVALIVGGVGAGVGAVLWLSAPSGSTSSTQVGFTPGGLQVRGTW